MKKLPANRLAKGTDDVRSKVFSGTKEVRKVIYRWDMNRRVPHYTTQETLYVATCFASRRRTDSGGYNTNTNNVSELTSLTININTPQGAPIVMKVSQHMWDYWYRGWNGQEGRNVINRYFGSDSSALNSYGSTAMMPGHNYILNDRGIWNPEFDDAGLDYINDNEDLKKWVTKQYMWLFPDFKNHFKHSRFHSPTMAELAVKYPGYAMMVRAGWSPTIAYTPSGGWQRTMYNQPNPKRLINYIYGKYSREFFNHLNENIMPHRENWFGLWLIRMGREFVPSEWLARGIDFQMEGEERWSPHNSPVAWKLGGLKQIIGESKPKRLMDIMSQAALSTANADLFSDSLRMYNQLQHTMALDGEFTNRGILEAFNFRHIDELHTRITERYREVTRVRQRTYMNGRMVELNAQSPLKPNERLLKNLKDYTCDGGLSFEVAETAGVVQDWGEKQQHCIASYIPSAHKGSTTLIGVYKNKALYANVSVSGKSITQLKGARNAAIKEPDQSIIKEAVQWALETTPKKNEEEKEELIQERV